jgi:hypothetical protein
MLTNPTLHLEVCLLHCSPVAQQLTVPPFHTCRLTRSFLMNRETAISYLNGLDQVYVLDGFANWDPEVCYCSCWAGLQQQQEKEALMDAQQSCRRSAADAAACQQHHPVSAPAVGTCSRDAAAITPGITWLLCWWCMCGRHGACSLCVLAAVVHSSQPCTDNTLLLCLFTPSAGSHQGARDHQPRLSCAVHAQHAHPPHRR